MVQVTRFNVRNPTKTIQVPRAPLHVWGVTPHAAVLATASAGITPPSSLILAHAPDQNAPVGFGCPYSDRSLQLVVTHCCELALPDVISANLSLDAWTHTPAVLLVHSLVSSQKTAAFANLGVARHSTISVLQFLSGGVFRGCSHSLMFRPPDLLATQIAPTVAFLSETPGSRGFYVHAYLGSLPLRAVDMLAVRIEQLTAWGLSPH